MNKHRRSGFGGATVIALVTLWTGTAQAQPGTRLALTDTGGAHAGRFEARPDEGGHGTLRGVRDGERLHLTLEVLTADGVSIEAAITCPFATR